VRSRTRIQTKRREHPARAAVPCISPRESRPQQAAQQLVAERPPGLALAAALGLNDVSATTLVLSGFHDFYRRFYR